MKTRYYCLLLVLLAQLTGCATKEVFFHQKATDAYAVPPAVRPSSFHVLAETKPAPLLAAAAPITPAAAPLPAEAGIAPSPATRSFVPLGQQAMETQQPLAYEPAVASSFTQPEKLYQAGPQGRKKAMVGRVEAGFALSLFGVISILLVFITPYLLYFSGLLTFVGLVLSIAGIFKINKNRDKLRGKVRAIAGIILGAIGTAVVIMLLNNNF